MAWFIVGVLFGIVLFGAINFKQKRKVLRDAAKMVVFYRIAIKWIRLLQLDKRLEEFFLDRGYKKIAIYGLREFGELLYLELRDSEVEVKYLIDQEADKIYIDADIKPQLPSAKIEDVDVIVVTAVTFMDQIREELKGKTNAEIISLATVIGGIKIDSESK